MKSFSLRNRDRTLNTLDFTDYAKPFSQPKLYPKDSQITFSFLYLWKKFSVPIKDLFSDSKFWYLHILIHIIVIIILLECSTRICQWPFNQVTIEDCFTVFWTEHWQWWNRTTGQQILKFLLERGDLNKWPTAELLTPHVFKYWELEGKGW